jgi:hypothetical protein
MREDKNEDARFSTMFDLYGLPNDFPGFDESKNISGPHERVAMVEKAFGQDIRDGRFLPYTQLHEYESLILSEPDKILSMFPEYEREIGELKRQIRNFSSPELINDGQNTAPSKRIIKEIPGYENLKSTAGPIIAQEIGLSKIRQKCPHFNQWLNMLETLNQGKIQT